MATLNRFTAETITSALLKSLGNKPINVFVSGGGMHNPLLMQHLKELLPSAIFSDTAILGINPDAKEAVLFAVLANETLAGGNTNFGKGKPSVCMGKVSFPK